MASIIACFVIFAAGFAIGHQIGYKNVMDDIKDIIDKVERANKR